MKSEKTYLVSGATGFIGRDLCAALILSGQNVRAISRKDDASLRQLGVELFVGGFNEDFLRSCLIGVDVIVHCAGNATFGNGKKYYNENVDLTKFFINAYKEVNPHILFVFLSSIGAVDRSWDDYCEKPLNENSYTNPTSDYGRSKLDAERIVRDECPSFLIIRPAMVVGNRMRVDSHFSYFADRAFRNKAFARISWPGEFSVIHVSDLSNAIVHLTKKTAAWNEVYFCSGEVISLNDFFNFCCQRKRIPELLVASLIKPFAKLLPFKAKALLMPALVASDEKLRSTGWSPKKNIAESLKEIIAREKSRSNVFEAVPGQTVITGAASGLGLSLTKLLYPLRRNLLLVDIDRNALEAIKVELPNVEYEVADLSDEQQLDALIHSHKWSHPISEIYLCAGIGKKGGLAEVGLSDHVKMFQINVIARIVLIKSLISRMRDQRFGRVVIVSSSSAFQPLPYMSTYAATNAALLSLGESFAEEELSNNIDVLTVCPGGMRTNFQKAGGVKEIEGEKLMDPKIVAEKILDGLKDKNRLLIVSVRSIAMSILARLLPRLISNRLWGFLTKNLR